MAKIMAQHGRPSRSSLAKICAVIHWQDFLWERQFAKVLSEHGWEKVSNWECLFGNREKGLFLSVYVDEIKLAGKKQNINPMWKVLNKEVDLGEPTSFLDHVYLGCTQRECETSKDYRDMFESRISAGAKEKLPCSGKPDADISSWSYEKESHAKKCVERYHERAKKTTLQLYKVATISSRRRIGMDLLENCQKYALNLC